MADDEVVGEERVLPINAPADDADFDEYVAGAEERMVQHAAREAELLAAEEASRAAEEAPESLYGDVAAMSNDEFDGLMNDPTRFGPNEGLADVVRMPMADGSEGVFERDELISTPAWATETDEQFAERLAALPYGDVGDL